MHQHCSSCANDVRSACDFEWEAKPSAGSYPPQLCFCLCNQNGRPQHSPRSLGLVPAANQYGRCHYRALLHKQGRHGATAASAPPVEEPRTLSRCRSRALCFPGRRIARSSRPDTLMTVSSSVDIDCLPSLPPVGRRPVRLHLLHLPRYKRRYSRLD